MENNFMQVKLREFDKMSLIWEEIVWSWKMKAQAQSNSENLILNFDTLSIDKKEDIMS